jgi:hypothetical protein
MKYIYTLTVWEDNSPERIARSKPYISSARAISAMRKALKATDILNELGVTKFYATAGIEEVTA